jgi:hypothetical protein
MLADPAAVRRFADVNERHADALDATAVPTIDGWKGVAANMFRNRAALVTARRVELSSAHRSAAGHLRVFAAEAEALLADMAVFARQQVAAMDDMHGLDFRIASAVDSGAGDRLSGDRSACDRRRQAAAHSRDVALAELTAAEKRCADHIADLAHVAPLQPMPPGGYGPPAPGSGGPGTNGSLGWPSSSDANRKPPNPGTIRGDAPAPTVPQSAVDSLLQSDKNVKELMRQLMLGAGRYGAAYLDQGELTLDSDELMPQIETLLYEACSQSPKSCGVVAFTLVGYGSDGWRNNGVNGYLMGAGGTLTGLLTKSNPLGFAVGTLLPVPVDVSRSVTVQISMINDDRKVWFSKQVQATLHGVGAANGGGSKFYPSASPSPFSTLLYRAADLYKAGVAMPQTKPSNPELAEG